MLISILIILIHSTIEYNILLSFANTAALPLQSNLQFNTSDELIVLDKNNNKTVSHKKTASILNSGMKSRIKPSRDETIVSKSLSDYDYPYESNDQVSQMKYPSEYEQDPAVEYEPIENYSTNSEKEDFSRELMFTKTLLNGTLEEVKKLQYGTVVGQLPSINRIKLSLNKKLAVWEILKNNQPAKVLTRADLESAGNLLLAIPEMDLFNLNYSNWEIVDYLGTLPGISRRKTGVIGYALKRLYGDNIIRKVNYVNRIKGILCAFSPQELHTITPDEFCLIRSDVFKNIRACTKRQLQVLQNIAMLSTVYGPTQAWSKNDTATLALLVSSLSIDDLQSIRPEAMEGIDYTTIEAMPREKLMALNEDQISYLNDLSLAALRRVTGIDSNSGQTTVDLEQTIYVLFILFWYFVISVEFKKNILK